NSATCILMATDNGYRLEDPYGARADVSAKSFWSSVLANGPFDCRVARDIDNNRWIVAALSDAHTATVSILVGISQTGDPAGNYFLFKVSARIGSDLLDVNAADSPMLGFNKNSVVVSIKMLNGTTGAFN